MSSAGSTREARPTGGGPVVQRFRTNPPAKVLFAFLVAASLITIGIDQLSRRAWLLWLEHWTGDWRTALLSDRQATQHPAVAIVSVTEETLEPLPYRSPIDRAYLAKLVAAIDAAGARSIGVDLLFLRRTEPAKDAVLAEQLKRTGAPVTVAVADSRVEISDAQAAYQKAFLRSTGARPGYANLLTGTGGVVRYVPEPAQDSEFSTSFGEAVAGGKVGTQRDQRRRIAWLLRPRDNSDTFTTVPAHILVPADGSPPGPAAQVLGNALKGKVVLIGAELPDVDYHLTPLNGADGDRVPGVFLHAQVAAQILDNRKIGLLAGTPLVILTFIVAFTGLSLGHKRGFRAYSIYGSLGTAALAGLDFALFYWFRAIMPFGACLVALFAGITVGMLLRRVLP